MKVTTRHYAETLIEICEGKSGNALELVLKDFVELLSDRHERSRWREIARSLEAAWQRRYGAATVSVETPQKITAALEQELQKRFPHATITQKIAPELLGGARVQIDDRILDGSLSGSLDRLKHQLVNS